MSASDAFRSRRPTPVQPAGDKTSPAAGAEVRGNTHVNNFDLIRIAAAVAVLVSHSFALAGRPEPMVNGINLGTLAVIVFFGISGYLVTVSWQREPRPLRFLTKRALRVLPALVVVLIAAALVLGPMITSSEDGYFKNTAVWRYLSDNLLFWEMRFDLPGVFDHNVRSDVNGSLWTLRSEVHAYIGLAVFAAVGLVSRRTWGTVFLLGAVGLTVAKPDIPYHYHVGTAFLLWAFSAGVIFAMWRREIPWRWPIAIVGLVAWTMTPTHQELVGTFVIPYVALMAAYQLPPVSGWLANRDVSYGTYLYAWPVQQLVARQIDDVSPGGMIAIALPVTIMLATLSWRLVERPALQLKYGWRQQAVKRPQPAPLPSDL